MKARMIQMVLVLGIILALLAVPAFAAETGLEAYEMTAERQAILELAAENHIFLNPDYARLLTTEELTAKIQNLLTDAPTHADPNGSYEVFTTFEEVAAYVRTQAVKREGPIIFQFSAWASDWDDYNTCFSALANAAFNGLLEHTDDPKEGDYLRGHWDTWECSADIVYDTTSYFFTVTCHITYLSNAEQEAAVDAKLATVLPELIDPCMTEYSKILTIYNYICDTIDYDWDHETAADELHHTAYAGLIKGECVCQGYATLFHRMCMEVGLNSRYVTGMAYNNDGTEAGAHAWNIVELDGMYYYLDATWDGQDPTTYHNYFLHGAMVTTQDDFNFTHRPFAEYQDFLNEYTFSQTDYVLSDQIVYEHQIAYMDETESDGCKAGYLAHYECTGCGQWYTDAAGTDTIDDRTSWTKPTTGTHSGGTATCCTQAVCAVCGQSYGALDASNHKSTEAVYFDRVIRDDGTVLHKKQYTCCGLEVEEAIPCSGSTSTCLGTLCDLCGNYYGEINPNGHASDTYTYENNNDGATHSVYYTCCGELKTDSEAHNYAYDSGYCMCGYMPSPLAQKPGQAPAPLSGSIWYGSKDNLVAPAEGFRLGYSPFTGLHNLVSSVPFSKFFTIDGVQELDFLYYYEGGEFVLNMGIKGVKYDGTAPTITLGDASVSTGDIITIPFLGEDAASGLTDTWTITGADGQITDQTYRFTAQPGQTYTITAACDDAAGNTGTAVTTIQILPQETVSTLTANGQEQDPVTIPDMAGKYTVTYTAASEGASLGATGKPVSAGTYTYTLTGQNGYCANRTGTVTIQAAAESAFVCETTEYITGYRLLLVYTNSDTAFTYNGAPMYDVSTAGYKYNKETAYTHVYAVILTEEVQEAQIQADATAVTTPLDCTDMDVNGSASIDLRDAVAVVAIYNHNEAYLSKYMPVVMQADINHDGVVNAQDFLAIKSWVLSH